MLSFKEIKNRVSVVDVLSHYGIKLRYRLGNDYADISCPLPMHPKHDKSNNAFGVHLPTGRWQCKHPTCAKENGVGDKWGDCLNLVVALDGCSFPEAAEKLNEWFPVDGYSTTSENGNGQKSSTKNPAVQKESGSASGHQSGVAPPQQISKANGNDSGKGFMHETGLWLDEVLKPVPEDERAMVKKLVAAKIYESYKNGKAAKT